MLNLGLGLPLEFNDDGIGDGGYTSFFTRSDGSTDNNFSATGSGNFSTPTGVNNTTPSFNSNSNFNFGYRNPFAVTTNNSIPTFNANSYLQNLGVRSTPINTITANNNSNTSYSGSPVGQGNSWYAKLLNTVLAVTTVKENTKQVQAAGYNPNTPEGLQAQAQQQYLLQQQQQRQGQYAVPPTNLNPDGTPKTVSLDNAASGIGDFVQKNGLLLAIAAAVVVLYKSGRT